MAMLKCKMCGATLKIEDNRTSVECEFCGSEQTLSKTREETIQNLFNRANDLRRDAKFDDAEKVYEEIVKADSTDAEAYWGIILCRYGIEYVEDKETLKRIPTCHRTQLESVLADLDYKKAIENADIKQRSIYEAEAKQIDVLQRDILQIVENEEPYDVFICYKEKDDNGERTQDSVIANDIYYNLTQEGFKVFYAAITLEGQLGTKYEPYIFAALNSAKVMLVVGSKPEYFNARWVKNEWSRYLKLIKKDRTKKIFPCYRDMDPYDLPEELVHLQAQDMSKIGFMSDIIRGINKVINVSKTEKFSKETVIVNNSNANTAPLLTRVFQYLEDGEWKQADLYCEKVLDIDPENGEAYIGKLMVDLQIKNKSNLIKSACPIDESKSYAKAIKFSGEKVARELTDINKAIKERIKNQEIEKRLASTYHKAIGLKQSNTLSDKTEAIKIFQSILDYRDSSNQIEEIKKDIYSNAVNMKNSNVTVDKIKAIKNFQSILDYRDSQNQIEKIKEDIYNNAVSADKQKIFEVEKAIFAFEYLGNYKDSSILLQEYRAILEEWERKKKEYREVEVLKQKTENEIEYINIKIADMKEDIGHRQYDIDTRVKAPRFTKALCIINIVLSIVIYMSVPISLSAGENNGYPMFFNLLPYILTALAILYIFSLIVIANIKRPWICFLLLIICLGVIPISIIGLVQCKNRSVDVHYERSIIRGIDDKIYKYNEETLPSLNEKLSSLNEYLNENRSFLLELKKFELKKKIM